MSVAQLQSQLTQHANDVFNDAFQTNNVNSLNLDPANPNELSAREKLMFAISYARRTRWGYQSDDPIVNNIHVRHQVDYALALLLAKQQMTGDFQGTESPEGIVAEYDPRAFYFGLGDGWRSADGSNNIYPTTSGSPQNLIHSGSTRLSGTNGNPIIFGKGVVHCLVGAAFYSDDITHASFLLEEINKQPQAAINVQGAVTMHHLNFPTKVVEFDKPRFLRENTEYRLRVFHETTAPATEWMRLIGVTFTLANVLQNTDPGNLDADALNNLKVVNTT